MMKAIQALRRSGSIAVPFLILFTSNLSFERSVLAQEATIATTRGVVSQCTDSIDICL